jgi:DNA topoisomerase-1
LRYFSDAAPGIRRRRAGKGFVYLAPDGAQVRNPTTLRRIHSLAIPPAWTDVWVCSSPRGHIQVTGRDAKGRKQYRYHPCWRQVRDETKYERSVAFGRALPAIRRRVEHDLALPGLPREKVLATVVRLLDVTGIRVGNDEYAKANGSFGLTTMRDRHVDVSRATIRFHFRGKSGKRHDLTLHDRRLALVVARCRDLPGYELFRYAGDDEAPHTVDAADVNDYLRQVAGEEFTAKDFRTWSGTVLAAEALRQFAPSDSEAEARSNVVQAIKSVAGRLGNTPAVCRKCYVHPALLDAYLAGSLREGLSRATKRSPNGLQPEEAAVLRVLEEAVSE